MMQFMSAGTSSWDEEGGERMGREGGWPEGGVWAFGMGTPCVVELRRCVVCVCVCGREGGCNTAAAVDYPLALGTQARRGAHARAHTHTHT